MKFTTATSMVVMLTSTATTTSTSILEYGPKLISTSVSSSTAASASTKVKEQDLLPAQLAAKKLHEKNFIQNFITSHQATSTMVPLSELKQKYFESSPYFRGKAQEQKILSHEEMKAHFPTANDSNNNNLRGLKTFPNNFFTIEFATESTCETPDYTIGYLVNYCYHNNDETSFLYKVNKKENLLIELIYSSNVNCDGIPDKIVNENLPDASYWGECIDGSKFTYYSEFPHPTYPTLGIIQTLEEYCTPGMAISETTVIGYDLDRATNCKKDTMNIWQNVDLTGCSTTGTFVLNYYINNQCTGPIAYQETWSLPTTCFPTNPTNDFIHPDKWVFQYYCGDPSGSTTPPEPVIPTCNYEDLYLYIGNGLCEEEYNVEGCDYDGGDCCVETCNEFSQDCPVDNSKCVDPDYA